jgi:hypothetical protein
MAKHRKPPYIARRIYPGVSRIAMVSSLTLLVAFLAAGLYLTFPIH